MTRASPGGPVPLVIESRHMRSTKFFLLGAAIVFAALAVSPTLPRPIRATQQSRTTEKIAAHSQASCAAIGSPTARPATAPAIERPTAEPPVRPGQATATPPPPSAAAMSIPTPPTTNGPTLVDAGLFINEITAISESDNSFRLEAYLDLIWCDPRLAFTPPATGSPVRVLSDHNAERFLDTIWTPGLDFANKDAPATTEDLSVLVHPDGTVEYRSEVAVDLETALALRAFPFDRQKLTIELEPFQWGADAVVLLAREELVGFSDEFHIPEWHLTRISERATTHREERVHADYSRLEVTLDVQRDPGVYVSKVIIPMLIITLITMVVYFLPAEVFDARAATAMSGLLTIVAYQFVVANYLPRHVYGTLLDMLILLSFAAVLLGLLEVAYTRHLSALGRLDEANRLNYACRFAMPLLYLGSCATAFFIFTRI